LLIGVTSYAGRPPELVESTFSEAMLAKAANRALAAALGPSRSDFTWTSLQVNRNTTAAPHRDVGTIGPSAIALFGDFAGGALLVDNRPALTVKHEALVFDSGERLHSSEPFTGCRFSLVWHSRAKEDELPPAVRAYLESLDFRVSRNIFSATLKVLYLFSGEHRRASLASALCLVRSMDFPHMALDVTEIDILNDPNTHDLMDTDQQEEYVSGISIGLYQVTVCTPPFNTWTRAVYANRSGPKPIRSAEYPLGFPWLSKDNRAKAEVGNVLVHFAVRCLEASRTARLRGLFSHAILEFPEDLGKAELGHPASPFQLDIVRKLFIGKEAYCTFAFFQCQLGANSSKPTRLITSVRSLAKQGFIGMPELDRYRVYKGPLPKTCGHSHEQNATGTEEAKSRLASMAAHPPGMNIWLAKGILQAAAGPSASDAGWGGSPSRPALPYRACLKDVDKLIPGVDVYIGRGDAGRGLPPSRFQNPWKVGQHGTREEVISKFKAFAEDSADVRIGARYLTGKRILCHCRTDEACHGDVLIGIAKAEQRIFDNLEDQAADGQGKSEKDAALAQVYSAEALSEMHKVGVGEPFMVARKGVARHIVDGSGVCSPGKWPPARRKEIQEGLPLELRSILERGARDWASSAAVDTRRLVMEIAAPRRKTPMPDAALIKGLQDEVITVLARRGHSPQIEGIPGRIDFGLLAAMAAALSDPDAAYPLEVAKGVPVGVPTEGGANPMPRASSIYEEKTKWSLPELEPEDLFDEGTRWANNYPSARAIPGILAKQFEEEIAEGCMLKMTLGEARRRWGRKLTVAALGAIEKTEDVFRVIYDASNTVKVNHRIRVQDQVRMPVWQDIARYVEDVASFRGARFAMAFDIRRAHRQIPIQEEDWGYLACRLDNTPEEEADDSDTV
jgi:hypothetical protein